MATFNHTFSGINLGYETNAAGWAANALVSVGSTIIGTSNIGGFRIPNLTIPQGYTIDSAIMTFGVLFGSVPRNILIYGNNVDDAAAWATEKPSVMAKTFAISDTITSGTNNFVVTSIIQAIINRTGWTSGNNAKIAFFPEVTDGAGAVSSNVNSILIEYSVATVEEEEEYNIRSLNTTCNCDSSNFLSVSLANLPYNTVKTEWRFKCSHSTEIFSFVTTRTGTIPKIIGNINRSSINFVDIYLNKANDYKYQVKFYYDNGWTNWSKWCTLKTTSGLRTIIGQHRRKNEISASSRGVVTRVVNPTYQEYNINKKHFVFNFD